MKKRLTAGLLVICMLLQFAFVWPFTVSAVDSATTDGYMMMNGVHINYENSLKVNGDGTYTLTMTLSSDYDKTEANTNNRVAGTGIYVAREAGTYLIETWGGNGGTVDGAGTGGAGGHVYGLITLEVGDVLYYTVGGNGESTTATLEGGGANGGGDHGTMNAGDEVAGGGGYTAVFLYKKSDYTDDAWAKLMTSLESGISEHDRTSKYIMIAGGGGGGGGSGSANGGAGGNMTSTSGALSGADYDVQGTFYSGNNGTSSGSTRYIGRGGSNVPGTASGTLIFAETTEPKSWSSQAGDGGFGSEGVGLGGGGGAGYCGGSGGAMQSIFWVSDVGGGGGGSSFIATGISAVADGSAAAGYLQNTNPSSTGGAVAVTKMDAQADFLSDVSLSGTLSKYFILADYTLSSGTLTPSVSADGSTAISVTGINLLPASGEQTLSITVEARSGFLGGNNVPLVVDETFICNASSYSDTILLDADCSYLNVPLNLKLKTENYTTNRPGYVWNVSELYTDAYADVRDAIANGTASWEYDFIESIGAIEVTQAGAAVSGTVAPTKTTTYIVSYDTSLKPGAAKVGSASARSVTMTNTSVITVFGSQTGRLGDYEMTYTRELKYVDDHYEMTLNITSNASGTTENIANTLYENPRQTYIYNNAPAYSVPVTGYYLIQVWAGNGQTGGGTYGLAKRSGGAGASGAYVQGYIYLEKDSVIRGTIGVNGGTTASNYNGGAGGGYTYVYVETTTVADDGTTTTEKKPLVIAGGGGGGSAASTWGDGQSATTNSTISTTLDESSAIENILPNYNGGKGADSSAVLGSVGAPGASAPSYRNPIVLTDPTAELETVSSSTDPNAKSPQAIYNAASSSDYTNGGTQDTGGAIYITFLQAEKTEGKVTGDFEKELSDFVITATVSEYFEILTGQVSAINNIETKAALTGMSATVSEEGVLTIKGITPEIAGLDEEDAITNADGTKTYNASIDFTVTIPLNPKTGFVGGNDVPILVNATTGDELVSGETAMVLSQTTGDSTVTMNVLTNGSADYGNVPLDHSAFPTITPNDMYYLLESGTGVNPSDIFTVENLFDPEAVAESEAWKYDYVKASNGFEDLLGGETALFPTQTTKYTLSAGLVPTVAEPLNATVTHPVSGVTASAEATVTVGYGVTYDLINLTTDATPIADGVYLAEVVDATLGGCKGYSFSLSAGLGFTLPESIRITVGGTELVAGTDYTYNSKTGEVVILVVINGAVTVDADATPNTFTVYVYVATAADGSAFDSFELITEVAGNEVDLTGVVNYSYTEFVGYDFNWNYNGLEPDANNKAVMPGNDVYIVGSYTPKEYTVVLPFEGAGKDTPRDLEATVKTGEDYTFTVPTVDGYVASVTTVTGALTVELIQSAVDGTVTLDPVVYTPTANKLTIFYINAKDNTEIRDTYVVDKMPTGTEFSVDSPVIDGYLCDTLTVTGKMDADGVTVYVYYTPILVNVTFDVADPTPNDEYVPSISETDRRVEYDNYYSVIVAVQDNGSRTYSVGNTLPTPTLVGSKFLGWFDANGNEVTADDLVNITSDTTLTAKWQIDQFTVTVHHVFEDGTQAKADTVVTVPFNTPYTVTAESITGYVAYVAGNDDPQSTISGTVVAQNKEETFIYKPIVVKLTINYLLEDGTKAFDSYTADVKYLDTYAITSKVYVSGGVTYTCSSPVVEGTVGVSDITVNVYYYVGAPRISVVISWGSFTFNLTRGVWDPTNHEYADDVFTPVDEGANLIKVENKSTIGISATFTYTPDSNFRTVSAYFADEGEEVGADQAANTYYVEIEKAVFRGNSEKPSSWTTYSVEMTLDGYIPHDYEVNTNNPAVTVGSVTVTIRGGGT